MNQFVITDHFGISANSDLLQTENIQKVFDLCRPEGGTVIIPKGVFKVSSLRMWSNTTLYLQSGAVLLGSDVCEDYEVFAVPDGVEMRSDMELITQYYVTPWENYRRAIISVYGEKNITIIGEEGSLIEGNDCSDPDGEEGYRGPHGIYITNVENLTLKGYTISNCGNFMHQIDNCKNIKMTNVTCTGGSDGVHLHCCRDILIEDCVFRTGDDNIAGINMENLTVRNCELNTSCDTFRAGGCNILVENCHIWGPGIYPHRKTVVQNLHTDAVRRKDNTLPREAGRHNTINVFLHFASTNFPNPVPYHNVVFRNCLIENVDKFLRYKSDYAPLQAGTHLVDITLENVTLKGLKESSEVVASAEEPLTVTLKNCKHDFREGCEDTGIFDGKDKNTTIITLD